MLAEINLRPWDKYRFHQAASHKIYKPLSTLAPTYLDHKTVYNRGSIAIWLLNTTYRYYSNDFHRLAYTVTEGRGLLSGHSFSASQFPTSL